METLRRNPAGLMSAGFFYLSRKVGLNMGTLVEQSLDHFQNYINRKSEMANAGRIYVGNDVKEATKRNLALDRKSGAGVYVAHQRIDIWFTAHSERLDKDYIGLMLVDYDPRVKAEADLSGVIYNGLNPDMYWPKTHDLVQGWGYKDMSCCSGPNVTSVPLEYLDLAPEHDSESCREWRADVRRKAGVLL